MENDCEDKKCVIKKLKDVGIKNYTINKAEVQDGCLVSITVLIDNKLVVITR